MSVRRIWKGMMSVRFGSRALRGVMCVYLYFGGDSKRELAICLQRGGACLSSSALHCTVLLFYPTLTQTQCAAVATVLL